MFSIRSLNKKDNNKLVKLSKLKNKTISSISQLESVPLRKRTAKQDRRLERLDDRLSDTSRDIRHIRRTLRTRVRNEVDRLMNVLNLDFKGSTKGISTAEWEQTLKNLKKQTDMPPLIEVFDVVRGGSANPSRVIKTSRNDIQSAIYRTAEPTFDMSLVQGGAKKPAPVGRLIRGRKTTEPKMGRILRTEEKDIALKRSAARALRRAKTRRVSESAERAEERAQLRQERERDLDILAPRTLQYRLTGVNTRNNEPDFRDKLLVKDLIQQSGIRNNVRVLYYTDGRLQRERTYTQTLGRGFKDRTFFEWLEGPSPQQTIFDIQWGEGDQLIIVQPASDIPARQIVQRYLDGLQHCSFSAPLQWAKTKLAEVTSNRSKQNYKRIIKIAKEYIKKYALGATIDEITKFCNKVKITYQINDVFNKLVHSIDVKNSRKTMVFNNSRINHLDLWMVKSGVEPIEMTQSELNAKYIELRNNKDRPHYKIDKKSNKMWIKTPSQIYRVKSAVYDIYNKFYDEYLEPIHRNIQAEHSSSLLNAKPKYDASIKNAAVRAHDIRNSCIYADEPIDHIVRSGLHQVGHHNYPNYYSNDTGEKYTTENSVRIDQHRAYASYKLCEYYQKFPFLFNEFANIEVPVRHYREFLKDHLGIYFIADVSYANMHDKNLQKHMREIKPYTEGYSDGISLPSPELMYMIDCGITFKILCGTWTHSTFDFDFPEFMHAKIDKVRHYQRLVGEWSAFRPEEVICIDGKEDWCADLKSKGYEAQYYSNPLDEEGEGTIQVTFKKELAKISHKAHLAAMICSYQRIQLFQQLANVPFEDTFAIITDEIAIRKSAMANIEIHEGFREKNVNKEISFSSPRIFLSSTRQSITFPTEDSAYVWGKTANESYRASIGAGGSGKTHSFMTNRRFLRKTYTAPSHALRQNKQDEFQDVHTECHCNMISFPGILRNIHTRTTANIFHDEVTNSSQEQVDKLRFLYPYSTIILGGDLDKSGLIYQLPCVEGTPVSIDDCEITTLKGNRRAKDDSLKKLLVDYRQMMRANYKYNNTQFTNTISYINTKKLKHLYSVRHLMTDKHGKYVEMLLNKIRPITDDVSYIQNTYVGKKGYDRLYAQGISVQSAPRDIRNYISSEFYNDIDIVNAGPAILFDLCEKLRRENPELADKFNTRSLRTLVLERERLFASMLKNSGKDYLDRSDIKQYFVAALNGGSPSHMGHIDNFRYESDCGLIDRFGTQFKKEIKRIIFNFKMLFPKIYKIAEQRKRCFISSLIAHFENKILNIMIDGFRRNRTIEENTPWIFSRCPMEHTIMDCVPMFDGLMIPKINGDIKKEDIDGCIYDIKYYLGFQHIQLKIKEPELTPYGALPNAEFTDNCRIDNLKLKVWRPSDWKRESHDEMLKMAAKLPRITRDQLKKKYTNDDYILTGKHTAIAEWTKLLKDKGYKYLVRKNGTKVKNAAGKFVEIYNGTIIKGRKLKTSKAIEERHAFTCHQIQGSTIRKKIYIDLSNLFDKTRMLYVALSRAEYLDQIMIITD